MTSKNELFLFEKEKTADILEQPPLLIMFSEPFFDLPIKPSYCSYQQPHLVTLQIKCRIRYLGSNAKES